MAEYRDLASQVNELVGRINGNYGTLEYSPVHYINQSISQVSSWGVWRRWRVGGGGREGEGRSEGRVKGNWCLVPIAPSPAQHFSRAACHILLPLVPLVPTWVLGSSAVRT